MYGSGFNLKPTFTKPDLILPSSFSQIVPFHYCVQMKDLHEPIELCQIWTLLGNWLTPVMLISKSSRCRPLPPSCYVRRLKSRVGYIDWTCRNDSWWQTCIGTQKKSFANKLDLLKRSRFLPRNVLKDFYCKVILPYINYAWPCFVWAVN